MTTETVHITEVGPRDGLQNEARFIPTQMKLDFIQALAQSGITTIEATSFVSPKWVPQMADHQQVLKALDLTGSIRYPVLIPNLRGLELAIDCGVKDIAVFTSASETFSQKNTHCSMDESLAQIKQIVQMAQKKAIRIRAYISCVFSCPYEGPISKDSVARVARDLRSQGINEIALGDTIGAGTAATTQTLLTTLLHDIPANQIAVHFHDTKDQALDNIAVALANGIRRIDCAASGLGGCPYAPGASGNVATEQVLRLLEQKGFQTNIRIDQVIAAGKMIRDHLNK